MQNVQNIIIQVLIVKHTQVCIQLHTTYTHTCMHTYSHFHSRCFSVQTIYFYISQIRFCYAHCLVAHFCLTKREKKRYAHLNKEFQRIARRDKKAFISDRYKEIEESNRMGKTRDLFTKLEISREHFMQRLNRLEKAKFRIQTHVIKLKSMILNQI